MLAATVRELALKHDAGSAVRELKELSRHGGVFPVFFLTHLLQKVEKGLFPEVFADDGQTAER